MEIEEFDREKAERANALCERRILARYRYIQRITSEYHVRKHRVESTMPSMPTFANMLHQHSIPWAPHGRSEVETNVRKAVGALPLNSRNFKPVLATTELGMVYFYATWDRACQNSLPLFDEAADAIREKFPNKRLVILAKVDCDKEGSINSDYCVKSYPTIKVFRNGEPLRGSYQGAYLMQSIKSYIIQELESPIKRILEPNELTNASNKRKTIIGHFDKEDTAEYDNFRRIAQTLKGLGDFHVTFGNEDDSSNPPNKPVIKFIPEIVSPYDSEETYTGSAENYDELNIWAHEKFMVQEMVFENFEALTKSPYPLLILYYNPNDTSLIKEFKKIVANNMMNRKCNVNFAVANGSEFTDGFEKYGKEESDLPLIAIESGKNIFLFPHSFDDTFPEKLKEFLHEFDIGKLQYIARTGREWTKFVAYLENPKERLDYVD